MVMGRKTEKLAEIETSTLSPYNQNAKAYCYGTKGQDVAQNFAASLAPFPKGKILNILDLGCGSGSDVKHFQSLGHKPVGLDNSEVFCTVACRILQQSFLNLDLPCHSFDGLLTNASLFHAPNQELPRNLTRYAGAALR